MSLRCGAIYLKANFGLSAYHVQLFRIWGTSSYMQKMTVARSPCNTTHVPNFNKHSKIPLNRFKKYPRQKKIEGKKPSRFIGNSSSNRRSLEQFTEFENLCLSPQIIHAIKQVYPNIVPTQIQVMSIKAYMSDYHSPRMISSSTGTGKTLAFLIPVLNTLVLKRELLKDEVLSEKLSRKSYKGKEVHSLIIAPSASLVLQTYEISKELCKHLSLNAGAMYNKIHEFGDLHETQDLDLLVSTTDSAIKLAQSGSINVTNISHLVVDEIDSMNIHKPDNQLIKLLDMLPYCIDDDELSKCSYTFCSSTLMKDTKNSLERLFPRIKTVHTIDVHKLPRKLRLDFVEVSGESTRRNACIDILKKVSATKKIVLIFCNTKEICKELSQYLNSRGYNAKCVTSDMDLEERIRIIKILSQKNDSNTLKVRKDPPLVVVSTDICSYGIDTTLVDCLILYQLPTTASDFIHRLGRIARSGKSGASISLVSKKEIKFYRNNIKPQLNMDD